MGFNSGFKGLNLDVLLVRTDYSNKKQKFLLQNYNDMSWYVIVSYML